MKWIYTHSMFVWFGLALAAPSASCHSYAELTYCPASTAQTLAYTVQTPKGFVTMLFAEEATVDGMGQTEFAGRLREGSTAMFRNGIVVVLPERMAEQLQEQAEAFAEAAHQQIPQPQANCTAGGGCEPGKQTLWPRSVGIRIVPYPHLAVKYTISFHARNSQANPRYTLPTTSPKDDQPPSLWIFLSRQALARFYKQPQDWGNCDPQQKLCG